MVVLSLTRNEVDLLNDIELVAHGDLYGIVKDDGPVIGKTELSEAQAALVASLRREGKFDKLVIHQGSPNYAEIAGKTVHGRPYTRKIKFN